MSPSQWSAGLKQEKQDGSITVSGIIDLAVNDTVEFWVWNETNTQNFIIDDIAMNLLQIGGT